MYSAKFKASKLECGVVYGYRHVTTGEDNCLMLSDVMSGLDLPGLLPIYVNSKMCEKGDKIKQMYN